MHNKLASANPEFQKTEGQFLQLQSQVAKTSKQRHVLEKYINMNVGSETKAVQYIREMGTLKKEIKQLSNTHD
jgi:predicted  nucleic acid-binding Zn-ribbon protein